MKNIWQQLPKPFFALAPMEAVTDVVFRHVVASAAKPDLFFTEFVNVSSYCSAKGIHSTKGRLAFTNDEQPIIAQIWGSKPEEFAITCKGLADLGYQAIDINMGCPDKAVIKTGAGSALIKNPENAARIIAASKTAGLPISVKTRIGDSKVEEWHDWIEHLLKQDLANLTIHLRTRKEMSKVSAHFELIPEIIKLRNQIAPKTLITINGDIETRQQGEELAKKYDFEGVMIGRGVFNNPFVFEETSKEHSSHKLIDLLLFHLDLHDKYNSELEPRKFDPLKRFFKIYIHNFAGAAETREKLMNCKNTEEVRTVLKELNYNVI